MSEEVIFEVPQPLYDIDAELNMMAMLEYIMREQSTILTDDEVIRVVKWFSDRYGSEEYTGVSK